LVEISFSDINYHPGYSTTWAVKTSYFVEGTVDVFKNIHKKKESSF